MSTTPGQAPDSTAVGEPLGTLAGVIGGPRVDHLLSRAALVAPERTAVGDLTYAALDARADRCASALRDLLPEPDGVVVAVATPLAPVFAVAYYGVLRAGAVAATVNPLLREEAVEHILRASGARVAILTPELHERAKGFLDRLPGLETVVLTAPDGSGDGVPVLDDLLDAAPAGPPPAARSGPDDVACVLFTSGTTGAPKAVELTHRNLVVNAAQTAAAHGLDGGSVMFNYLPTYHLMHLNIAVHSAAGQILWTDPDVVASVDAAVARGVTHYYSLPMRLAKLAADPALPGLKMPGVRAVLSGGSALPPAATERLAQHFGIPVVQGYGLAEASPQTHFDNLAAPRPGSCGRPGIGTEARIVAVETRQVLPPGERGEIQVRGPQLMKGYRGEPAGAHLDAEGWFSTGDIGHADEGGRLFVVDRVKDVFKCDNFLVAPTEIERVVAAQPAVRDCVVVDVPHPFSGAVPYALIVPQPGEAGPPVADAIAAANDAMPYYQAIRYFEVVDRIPRSGNGKVQRRVVRDSVHARTRPAAAPAAEGERPPAHRVGD